MVTGHTTLKFLLLPNVAREHDSGSRGWQLHRCRAALLPYPPKLLLKGGLIDRDVRLQLHAKFSQEKAESRDTGETK